jgi:hypothetical protein
MKYVEPQITNTLKADSTIQGLVKDQPPADLDGAITANSAYRADE